ncbi:hypothetical protein Cob_v008564 [Colletotrichum orbiculare MAFF 240422]|uniref:Uncharacterized protein n=1 Tax=Colletotrichum orbiculare (strain 104-T / ATCC 96160 / CBS 514.97 / LARS 414 / MAFF 240422) TaxID=1213857 RepID=A0A484FLJ1_COLOR|nr:hypothetical protein Cob_v008564 [Colletotrichum orbiculare MAFF 240422]
MAAERCHHLAIGLSVTVPLGKFGPVGKRSTRVRAVRCKCQKKRTSRARQNLTRDSTGALADDPSIISQHPGFRLSLVPFPTCDGHTVLTEPQLNFLGAQQHEATLDKELIMTDPEEPIAIQAHV